MAFNFGQAGTGGFNFGAPKTTAAGTTGFGLQTSAPAGGALSFGASQPQTQTFGNPSSQIAGLLAQPMQNNGSMQAGFSFGAQTQSTTSSGGFSFGASLPKLSAPAASQPATTSVTLGASAAGAGFSFGGLTAQTTAAQQPLGGFGFGTPKVQASSAQPTPALSLGAQPTGLALGTSTAASTAPTAAINFGIKTSATPAPISSAQSQSMPAPVSSLFAAPIASTPATGFTLGSSMASVAPVVSLASSAPTSLSLKPLGAAAPAISTAAVSTGATTGFSLGLKTVASVAPAITTSTSTAIVTTSTAPVMSYAQLEALINKWSSELEDQERHFLQNATRVNAWDRMLVENGEKITALHKDMEKVKLDQRRLDQELDFILSQQKELEDLLGPLEESVKEQSGTIYMQNADEERERTYKLAENVDAQLKRMSHDLKEIIEHLNTSSGPADTTDPLQQICKILNAHMDSLQWVEQNSVLLHRRVEEVSKLCESRSKDQEKSFRLNFQ
ncbi:nuclear pore glycoprotein p62-like isoform X2 [Sinocyclocheilus anshuiensis]|uniref:nuclear pore glycoprotein p62-like isoform X2 n=1 Tax=Sinocyclocheilus anshuiensis TaxID=1608454 RepID=UPI0007BADC4D|nr:PREDICTED: nuclear pore glycoprotein p62-like isoform X2 [Sinocyclocheilus anshuiensis]